MAKSWLWITEVVTLFRERVDKSIDKDMTIAILTYKNYPFGKYKNAEGKNVYPISIIESYIETKRDREKIKEIVDTIRYNRLTSEEITKRREKRFKEYSRPWSEVEQMRKDAEREHEERYQREITDNPPESSMRYVSDRQLRDDEVFYENLKEEEQLSDVDGEWKPKEGLFTMKSANYIANYLERNSDSLGQAIKRLTFYMNRSGENLTNKQVLKKAKKILQERNEKEKADR